MVLLELGAYRRGILELAAREGEPDEDSEPRSLGLFPTAQGKATHGAGQVSLTIIAIDQRLIVKSLVVGTMQWTDCTLQCLLPQELQHDLRNTVALLKL